MKDVILAKLKTNKLLRFILYPFCSAEHFLRIKRYKIIGYGEKLNKIKNLYNGKRCFIIGNGPSLIPEDLEKIKNEYTFAANRIFLMYSKTSWRPTFYCIVDSNVFEGIRNNLQNIEAKYIFIDLCCNYKKADIDKNNTFIICSKTKFYIEPNRADPPFISEDICSGLSDGRTVTYAEIQLAIFMGFREIFLIGVDHNFTSQKHGQNHFKDDNSKIPAPLNLNSQTKAYEYANKYANSHNIKIYNATRGGKLEAFERINLDSLF